MSADVMQLPTVAASDDSKSNVDDHQPFGPVICYRDPADVRTIRRQSRIIILCLDQKGFELRRRFDAKTGFAHSPENHGLHSERGFPHSRRRAQKQSTAPTEKSEP